MVKIILVALLLVLLLLPSVIQAAEPQQECFGGWGTGKTLVCRLIDYDMGVVCYMYASAIFCVKIEG